MSSNDPENNPGSAQRSSPRDWLLKVFLHWGVMPFLLVIAVVAFSLMSSRFLTAENLVNLFRQSVYLVLVSLGQMLALSSDWVVKVIGSVGNYGEIYDRNLGPETPFAIERGLNALWTDGGLLYAPPYR